jgi:protease I
MEIKMKSIILTHSMYQDQEVIYPYYRLQEEGEVLLVAENKGKVRGILGTEIEAEISTKELYARHFTSDLLVLPGGVKAMEKLRQDKSALEFVALWASLNKPIASMCSGAQMLISTRVPLKGRRLAAYPAMAVDVENAGAIFVDEPVVIDGNIVSSPHYKWLAEWMKAAISSNFTGCVSNRLNFPNW